MEDEELKQQEQQEDKKEDNEEKKSLIKKIIIGVIIFLLLSGIIFLILFGVSKCSKASNNSSSSNEPAYTERYSTSNLDNVFKKIIKASLDDNSVVGEVSKINTVSYVDNKTSNNTFDLCITALGNDNHFYYLSISNALYQKDSQELIPYLLDISAYLIDGDVTLKSYEVINETINTSKVNNKYVIVKSTTDNKYLSGYYYEDNTYHVYPIKELLDSSDPFLSEGKNITSEDLLFDYYYFLLSK